MAGKHRPKISTKVKLAAYERDEWTCQYCGLVFDPKQTWTPNTVAPWMNHPTLSFIFLELDHIHPLSRGGTNDLDNLRAACSPCNRRKCAYLQSSKWSERFEAARKLIHEVEPGERGAEKVIELLIGRRFKMREVKH